MMACYTRGLSVSELVGLKGADLNLDAGLVVCHGKGSKERRVPIGKSAAHWLQQYAGVRARAGYANKPHLFLSNLGTPLTRHFAGTMMKRYSLELGLKHVSPPHARHSFATHLLQRGADSRSVQAPWAIATFPTNANLHTHRTAQCAHLRPPPPARRDFQSGAIGENKS